MNARGTVAHGTRMGPAGPQSSSCSVGASSGNCSGADDAYRDAGGPTCGSNEFGNTIYCEPGDSCLDDVASRCG